jgi:hypothetical protein
MSKAEYRSASNNISHGLGVRKESRSTSVEHSIARTAPQFFL